jgi:hypothetical protein
MCGSETLLGTVKTHLEYVVNPGWTVLALWLRVVGVSCPASPLLGYQKITVGVFAGKFRCCGSVTFSYGSGNPYRTTNPDPDLDPDPSLFVRGNKKMFFIKFFLLIMVLFEGTFT